MSQKAAIPMVSINECMFMVSQKQACIVERKPLISSKAWLLAAYVLTRDIFLSSWDSDVARYELFFELVLSGLAPSNQPCYG